MNFHKFSNGHVYSKNWLVVAILSPVFTDCEEYVYLSCSMVLTVQNKTCKRC